MRLVVSLSHLLRGLGVAGSVEEQVAGSEHRGARSDQRASEGYRLVKPLSFLCIP